MTVQEPIHLATRDRLALGLRLAGAGLGLIVIVFGFASSSWSSPWVLGLFVFIVVGGGLSYYLLTSIVRCPSCAGTVSNFRIADEGAKRKTFLCAGCGTSSWLAEGFYWQD